MARTIHNYCEKVFKLNVKPLNQLVSNQH